MRRDGVAETPAAERFVTVLTTALRPLRRKTGTALTARRNRSGHHAIADFVAGDTFAQFFDDADWLVTDDQARLHRILAAQDVQIGSTDRRQRDANNRFAETGARSRHFFYTDVVCTVKYVCPHRRR